jgi:hypothetical protein
LNTQSDNTVLKFINTPLSLPLFAQRAEDPKYNIHLPEHTLGIEGVTNRGLARGLSVALIGTLTTRRTGGQRPEMKD